jgi:hypothetical protein
LSYRSGDILSPKVDPSEPLSDEMADFIAAARTGKRVEFHETLACRVVRMIEAADRSLKEGGREVTVAPLGETPLRSRRSVSLAESVG